MSYAGWLSRAGAFLIDLVLVGVVIGLVRLSGIAAEPGALSNLAVVLVIAAVGVNRWYLGGKSGQSVGRRLLGIKLVNERGSFPIGVLSAFLRDVVHTVDTVLFYIGWLFPLWDAKKQTLADKITGTVVVKA